MKGMETGPWGGVGWGWKPGAVGVWPSPWGTAFPGHVSAPLATAASSSLTVLVPAAQYSLCFRLCVSSPLLCSLVLCLPPPVPVLQSPSISVSAPASGLKFICELRGFCLGPGPSLCGICPLGARGLCHSTPLPWKLLSALTSALPAPPSPSLSLHSLLD